MRIGTDAINKTLSSLVESATASRDETTAHLIAAAPELLEALRMLADDHEHGATGTIRQEHLRAARAAIARAEGRDAP